MRKTVVFRLPGMDDVPVESSDRFDLYRPAGDDWRRPAVVFACGFPDPTGRIRQAPPFTSWARLVAAAGLVGVLYGGDLDETIRALAKHPAIDPERIALVATSGHGPTALAQLARGGVSRAALLYAYTTDCADAAARFGFAAPPIGELPPLPLHVVRAGADEMPGLNVALDRFIAHALARDLPVTVRNVPGAPHAFGLVAERADVIRGVLEFLSGYTRSP